MTARESEAEGRGALPDTPPEALPDALSGALLWAEPGTALHDRIAAKVDVTHLPGGEELFGHGDPGDALYVVGSGRLEVINRAGTVIETLGKGAVVGELALLTGEPRSATVRAVRDSELLRLDRRHFEELLRGDAEFAVNLTSMLGRRLAGTVEPHRPRERHVVTVLATSGHLPTATVVDRLHHTIGGWVRVARLGPEDGVGRDDIELGRILDRAERANDVVLLSSPVDAEPAWRRFCLRQADRVLLLVDAAGSPPERIEPQLVERDVAFVGAQPPSAQLSGPWLDRLRPVAQHWIPTGAEHHRGVDRVARRMQGRSVGIALSGGGARGFAHVGVVAALREAGIEIDRYGGTSVGAFVAALFATGRSPEEVVEVLRAHLVARRPFADYTLPRKGLIRARRARRMFHDVFGEQQLEELPLDCFGVSADLITGEMLVHRRGPLRHVIGASMSLPGLAPPLPWAGRLAVDGGVVNNLPVDVMADTAEGPVIAVEVMRRWHQEWEERLARARAGGDSSWWRPRVPVPSLVETLSCSIGLGNRAALDAARDEAWLTVVPELADFGLLEWGRLDEAVAEGRRAARVALSAQDAVASG